MKIVTVEEMRAIEAEGDASGVSYEQMMDNAGRALADRVIDLLGEHPVKITVLVGSGNNGGDALVAGRLIAAETEHEVNFYLTKPRDDYPHFIAVKEAGLFTIDAEHDKNFSTLTELLATSVLVIDGVLGIGITLPIKGSLAKFMKAVHAALDTRRYDSLPITYDTPTEPGFMVRRRPYVVAVDCPSGLDCDTGAIDDLTLPADETMTFAAAKRGQVLFPGAGVVGDLHVAPIGLPATLENLQSIPLEMVTSGVVHDLLPLLALDSHKGTFGKAMLAAGSLNYTGAAALAAGAAYRAGAGLVTVATPQPIMPILAAQVPEATWLLLPHDMGVLDEKAVDILKAEVDGYSALLLGPGWGHEATTGEFLHNLLQNKTKQQHKGQIGFVPTAGGAADADHDSGDSALPPLVIDADGLNLLSEIDDWWELLPAQTILTPHPGEMARLTGLSREDAQADRITLAQEKAAAWDCIVVLKGAHTVIAAPDGSTSVLPFAEPALATAGTGDVLAGAITGLLAQGLPPYDAARAGGYLHGLAGRLAAVYLGTARSVTAQTVLETLSDAMSTVEQAI